MVDDNRDKQRAHGAKKEEEIDIPDNLGEVEEIGENESEDKQDEVVRLRRELEKNRDRMLRVAAESENFKKRMQRERDTMLKYAGENILRELLTTVDNLDRALEQVEDAKELTEDKVRALIEGVQLTRKGLLGTLEKFDVTPLESVGEKFDPELHEALTMEASDKVPAQHVLQEFVKGYKYKDRLLRAAKVAVSNGPAE